MWNTRAPEGTTWLTIPQSNPDGEDASRHRCVSNEHQLTRHQASDWQKTSQHFYPSRPNSPLQPWHRRLSRFPLSTRTGTRQTLRRDNGIQRPPGQYPPSEATAGNRLRFGTDRDPPLVPAARGDGAHRAAAALPGLPVRLVRASAAAAAAAAPQPVRRHRIRTGAGGGRPL